MSAVKTDRPGNVKREIAQAAVKPNTTFSTSANGTTVKVSLIE